MKSRRSRVSLILVICALILGGGIFWFMHRGQESTDDAAIDGRPMTISPKVSGYVKTLNINDNQAINSGDVLLEIDPTDYINKFDHMKAALEAAEAAASASKSAMETTDISAPSNLEAAQAQVVSAEANWDKAVNDLKRMQRLSNEARSQEQLDQAIAAEKSAHSNLMDTQAKLRSAATAPKAIATAQAQRDQLLAEVKQAQADVAQAEQDLANTKIIAPADGRISRRSVEQGDYVQTGQQLGALVGTELWVTANFKETQLDTIRAGQKVKITVDAYSDLELDGRVDSIQSGTGAFFSAFPPENATGNFVKIVQRVPVKIVFDKIPDPSLRLGPGMSVIATVYTRPESDPDTDAKKHANDKDDAKDE
jgi:membrane fusion protein (multidrug efflux system)